MQEGNGVAFDLIYPQPEFGAEEIVFWAGMSLAGYGAWRVLVWLIERKRGQIPWARLRIWWPTVMLSVGYVVLAALRLSKSNGVGISILEYVRGVVAGLNFPAVVAALAAMTLMEESPMWLRDLCGAGVFWLSGYAMVRFIEWRAWSSEPVKLELDEPKTRRKNRHAL